jgi:hypothetical protein
MSLGHFHGQRFDPVVLVHLLTLEIVPGDAVCARLSFPVYALLIGRLASAPTMHGQSCCTPTRDPVSAAAAGPGPADESGLLRTNMGTLAGMQAIPGANS